MATASLGFPNSPHVVRGGIALIDPDTSALIRTIAFQYNPDSLSRTLQVQGIGGGNSHRSEALRLTGPPIETIKLEAEIDGTDALEVADPTTVQSGILPQLAALETLIYPDSSRLQDNNSLSRQGTLEIAPMQSALTLFIWSKNRILPVRLTECTITEDAFDVNLNPIRAKISLGMRVLNIDDLDWDHKGSSLYMIYQQGKEQMAGLFASAALSQFGIASIP
jgi:hypothetical protein